MPHLCDMNSLCIHGAKELGTGQTAAHPNCRAGLDTWGKGDLQCHGSGWWIWRSKREPVNSPEVWKLPKTCEMSNASCQLRGWPAGTVAVGGQISPKTSPHVHPLSGSPSARRKGPSCKREHKTQYGNMEETWKSRSSWCSVVLSAFKLSQFYTKCMKKEIWA